MAIPTWLKLSKTSGSGDANIAVSATTQNYGRNEREYTLTISSPNTSSVQKTVKQSGSNVFVSLNQNSYTFDSEGGNLIITGTSNAKYLTWQWQSNTGIIMSDPTVYTVNGKTVTNGAPISDDPGATASYEFSYSTVVPKNESLEELTKKMIITPYEGSPAFCDIKLSASSPFLNVETVNDVIVLESNPAGSGTQSLIIDSNTSWTIS